METSQSVFSLSSTYFVTGPTMPLRIGVANIFITAPTAPGTYPLAINDLGHPVVVGLFGFGNLSLECICLLYGCGLLVGWELLGDEVPAGGSNSNLVRSPDEMPWVILSRPHKVHPPVPILVAVSIQGG